MNAKRSGHGKAAIFICAFLIPFIMMQIFWAICGMYPFGNASILTGDMDIEFVNFYAYFINTLRSNNDWSYMLTKTLGGDFPGLAAFQLHDPLLFLLLMFPGDKIATGIELIFTLQISIAGLSMSVLLNNRYRVSFMSLLFSTGYAFCSFFFGYLVLTIYFGALCILPLVLYFFLDYLDDRSRFIPFTVSACLFIFINYHMGFMLVIFLVILYISRIICDSSVIRRLPEITLSGITILLIDGFFLLRTGLSLLGEKTTQGADYGFYRRFPVDQLLTGLLCGTARNDLRPLIYCGVAAFFFTVLYFISSSDSIRTKIANLFIIAAVAVSMWINAIDAVWHGFNNPEGFYWRYAYYISITVVVLGYKGFISAVYDGNEEHGKKVHRHVLISAGLIAAYLAAERLLQNPYLDNIRFLINAGLVIVAAAAALMMRKSPRIRTVCAVILLAVSFAEMLYNAKTSYFCLNSDNGKFPLMSEFKEDYHDINSVISAVKARDDGFYRIEKDFDRAINDPSMFDYIGLSHDSSCEKDEILDWLVNFGFCKTVYFTYYNGGSTSFVDNLFGIKYYVSRFDSVEKPYESMPYEGKYHAYSNPYALPMAFIAPAGLSGEDISDGDTFEKQNRIASYWSDKPVLIKADVQTELDGVKETEPGQYERINDEGFIVYNITVDRNMPLYFYFYAPQRQNGEVFVNGESRDVYFTVNHWNTLCAGTYEPGEELEIRMKVSDDELSITKACFYYEDPAALREWSEAAKKLNFSIGDVQKITSSHLVFNTSGSDDKTVVLSIPYEDSWTVTCDGKKIEGSRCLDMLMSFDVPAGDHTIEMRYTPKGTWAGLLLTIAGIVLFIGRCGNLFRNRTYRSPLSS